MGNGAGRGKFLYSVVFLQIKAVHLVGQAASSSRLLSKGHLLKSPLVLVFHFSLQKLETVCV